jgi:hypothetical protein
MWTTICLLGKSGFKTIIQNQLENKKLFMKTLQAKYPKIKIITDDNGLTCGLIIPNSVLKNISKTSIRKYSLFAKTYTYTFYKKPKWKGKIFKIFFLPHIKRKTLVKFFDELK